MYLKQIKQKTNSLSHNHYYTIILKLTSCCVVIVGEKVGGHVVRRRCKLYVS